jgi:hypothetical protein
VPDDAAGLRAANARLRGLLADRDADIAGLRRERERRLKLRLVELERRLGMEMTRSPRNAGSGGSVKASSMSRTLRAQRP